MKTFKYILLGLMLPLSIAGYSQRKNIEEIDYRRSSLYSILINHTEQRMGPNIADVFLEMPVPDKYNDHDLSVKIIEADAKLKKSEKGADFLRNNNVASHLVARWFNRNPLTGQCDVDLIRERGLYNASQEQISIAGQTIRGNLMLQDAGEDLIHNTFVLVNDIRYIDKEKQGEQAGIALNVIFSVLGAVAGGVTGTNMSSLSDFGRTMQQMMETLKGFKVNVNTHLYRLAWDEETAAQFYESMYSDKPDNAKKEAFENNRDMFKLEYVGSQLSSGSDVSFLGVNLDTPDEMIRKACTRAIDENVANLAHNFEFFRVKVKLTSAEPIQAPIGMKEDVNEKSRFEVLLPELKNGKMTYKQVAIIKPKKNFIWDNRYMAFEEGATGANLNYTTFEKVSGGEIAPGMLIREIGKK